MRNSRRLSKIAVGAIGLLTLAYATGAKADSSGAAGSAAYMQQQYGAKQDEGVSLITGAADYAYPIEVVPGTNGIQPKVAIGYNSGGGFGRAGYGWDITGLGAIARSTKKGSPTYTANDTFVRDGEDLVKDAAGNYHEAHEDFSRIQNVGGFAANSSWVVTETDGTQFFYGETTDSRIEALTATGARADGQIRTWALSRSRTTDGNEIRYSYIKQNGQVYIDTITYTYNTGISKYRQVKFSWAARTDVTLSYGEGARVKTDLRLTNVRVYTNVCTTGCTPNLVRRYDLAYSAGSAGKSLLASIQEVGSDADTAASPAKLPPTKFTYQAPTLSFAPAVSWGTATGSYIRDIGAVSSGGSVGGSGSSAILVVKDMMDINGDGLIDSVYRAGGSTSSSLNVNYNTGSGFAPAVSLGAMQYMGIRMSDSGYTSHDMLDINGDGLVDDVFRSQFSGGYSVKLNNGNGFNGVTSYGPGPGLGAVRWEPSITVQSSSGTTTYSYTQHDLLDLNGDGRVDDVSRGSIGGFLGFHIGMNTGSNFSSTSSWGAADANWYIRKNDAMMQTISDTLDMNGDGLPDLVLRSGTGAYSIRFNNGNGFDAAATTWGGTAPIAAYVRKAGGLFLFNGYIYSDLVDVNNDNLPDLIYRSGTGNYAVQLNTGLGLEAQVSWGTGQDSYVRQSQMSGAMQTHDLFDMNGDGLPDDVYRSGSGAFSVRLNSNGPVDLLTKITNSSGGTTTYGYTPSTKFDNRDTGGIYRMPFHKWLVTSIATDDGMGTTGTTTYSYKGGFFDMNDREFRGFREVTETSPDGSKAVRTFLQDDIFMGMMAKEELYLNSTTLQSRTVNTWDSTLIATGINFPFLVSTTTSVYEGQATPRVTRESFEYDSYGNATIDYDEGDLNVTGDESRVTTEYAYNTTNWNLDSPKHVVTEGYAGGAALEKVREQFTYYDNQAYGVVTAGNATRVDSWLDTTGTNLTVALGYDAYGNVRWKKDARANAGGAVNANGHTISTSFDATYFTVPVSSTNAVNLSKTTSYDALLRPASVVEPNGAITSTTYDTFSRVLTVVRPGDSASFPTITKQYFDDGVAPEYSLTSQREKSGVAGTFDSYVFTDGFGNVVQTKREAAVAGHWVAEDMYFDALERKTATSIEYDTTTLAAVGAALRDTTQRKVSTTYDGADRPVSKTDTDGSVETTAYFPNKWVDTDALGRAVTTEFDSDRRISKKTETIGGIASSTTYKYNSGTGEVLSITDAQGAVYSFAYDSIGRKTETSDQAMGLWSYAFDATGNVIGQTDGRNQTTTSTFDAANRILTMTAADNTRYVYTYGTAAGNNLGQLVKVEAFTPANALKFQRTYNYDSRGRAINETKTIDDKVYAFDYTYDAADRVVTQKYPDGEIVTTTYDARTMVYGLSGSQTYVGSSTYTPHGKMLSRAFGNGTTATYDYYDTAAETDPSSALPFSYLLKNIKVTAAGGVVTMNQTYQFDKVGNIGALLDGVAPARNQSFTYDEADRVKTATGVYGSKAYAYTAAGDITSKDGRAYTYGAGHRVSSDGVFTYTHDGNGNVIARTSGGTTETFNYNAENRLQQSNAGGVSETYVYDETGERIKKISGSKTTYYADDSYEEDWNGGTKTVTKHYFVDGDRIATRDAEGLKFQHSDHLDSTARVTNSAGAEVKAIYYDPYGSEALSTGSAAVKYKFTGKEQDATSLYYYSARHYDPVLGRFMSADTLLADLYDPQQLNRFAYARNNPIIYNDPTGHAIAAEGGWASLGELGRFWGDSLTETAADQAMSETWRAHSPNYGVNCPCNEDGSTFDGVSYTPEQQAVLDKVPKDRDELNQAAVDSYMRNGMRPEPAKIHAEAKKDQQPKSKDGKGAVAGAGAKAKGSADLGKKGGKASGKAEGKAGAKGEAKGKADVKGGKKSSGKGKAGAGSKAEAKGKSDGKGKGGVKAKGSGKSGSGAKAGGKGKSDGGGGGGNKKSGGGGGGKKNSGNGGNGKPKASGSAKGGAGAGAGAKGGAEIKKKK